MELAQSGHIPVINGLTDHSHPCQILADILTFEEHKGPIAGRKLAWVGDGNNVANTFIKAAVKFNFALTLACPKELPPDAETIDYAKQQGADVTLAATPAEAVKKADAVITDCWVSMGDRDAARRHRWLEPYQITEGLMQQANEGALFMHCLPAHRGEEMTAEVIDGPRSVVFDEAENRLHAQKGILLWCFKII